MPAVYDQGQLGSCVSNATAAAYEFGLYKQGKADLMPSRLDLYYQARAIEGTVDQDAGATVRDGIKVANKPGVCPEAEWPYDITTFAGPPPADVKVISHSVNYYALHLGAGSPLRACLAAGYPFQFGFNVPQEFESQQLADGSNVLLSKPGPNDTYVGGHSVLATGYDFTGTTYPVPVFECRNSWGDQWGDAGYFYMAYDCFSSICSDIWTVRTTS